VAQVGPIRAAAGTASALGHIEGGGRLSPNRDESAEQVLFRLEVVCGRLAETGFHKELAQLLDEALVKKGGPGRGLLSKTRRARGNHAELRLLLSLFLLLITSRLALAIEDNPADYKAMINGQVACYYNRG